LDADLFLYRDGYNARVALAEGLDIPERNVNGVAAGRYVGALAGVRLDLPVDVVKLPKVKGEPQRYRIAETALSMIAVVSLHFLIELVHSAE
jgi:hypothetical protein